MAATNTSISLASLDFDTLKTNLKNFLRTQSAFKDYDYDGSNMNVLLDVLSYNTYMNAFYLNMAVSEMFLDSAQLRSSVASHAKTLNYTPRSKKSAEAFVDITIPTTNAVMFTIPRGTTFTGTNGYGNFIFSTDKTYVLTSGNNTFVANGVPIYEGTYTQDSFVIDYSNETQTFTLVDSNIDTDSLIVIVSENGDQDVTQFRLAKNLYGLNANSNVYFLQTDIDGKYQIQFGDNIFGRKPLNGALVTAEYRSCSGSSANEVDTFIIENQLDAINNTAIADGVKIVTVDRAMNGANAEGIESIRYNAPRHFQTQERVVTTQDYIDLILANFPDIESVNVYGGETISGFGDVEYGKVYISCSTYAGNNLTDSRKKDLIAFLQPRAMLGITPVLIDPEDLYITLTSKVHIDFNQTSLSPSQIKSFILNIISKFNDDNLKRFGSNFRMSSLMSTIDAADDSVISNETTAFIYKRYTNLSSTSQTPITVDFHLNQIRPGSVVSNQFSSGGKSYIYTDYIAGVNNAAGNLFRLEKTTGTTVLNYTVAGTIDYTTGTINIVSSTYDSVPSGGLRVFAAPVNQDIYSARNNIVNIDTATGVLVTVVSD